jgi:hypothetical protein
MSLLRVEPCICGGSIKCITGLEPEAVQLHNMSLTHRVWRLGRESSTASVVIRDVSECSPRASGSPAKGLA